jgi:ABC-type uncharacterized transport system substrate-binding protein
MRRREFLLALGGVAALPRLVWAQAKPVIGLLHAGTAEENTRRLAAALARGLPTIFDVRDYVEAGGLSSYGSDYYNVMELAGGYAARVLKGERPADLPVQQATKFEFVVNRKTAKALGIEIAPTLLTTADDVID